MGFLCGFGFCFCGSWRGCIGVCGRWVGCGGRVFAFVWVGGVGDGVGGRGLVGGWVVVEGGWGCGGGVGVGWFGFCVGVWLCRGGAWVLCWLGVLCAAWAVLVCLGCVMGVCRVGVVLGGCGLVVVGRVCGCGCLWWRASVGAVGCWCVVGGPGCPDSICAVLKVITIINYSLEDIFFHMLGGLMLSVMLFITTA